MLKVQVAAVSDAEPRTLLKTIRARPIARRLDGPKRCIRTQVIGRPIIRVAHEAADLTVLAVPAACPMRRSTEGCHGHSRTTPQAPQPGLTHVGQVAEET